MGVCGAGRLKRFAGETPGRAAARNTPYDRTPRVHKAQTSDPRQPQTASSVFRRSSSAP